MIYWVDEKLEFERIVYRMDGVQVEQPFRIISILLKDSSVGSVLEVKFLCCDLSLLIIVTSFQNRS